MVPGPPLVSAQTMSNRRNRSSARIRTAIASTGQIAGRTILRKVTPEAGAVDLGGLELRFVDVGQRRQQQQEHERRPLPDLGDQDRRVDEGRIDGPEDRHLLAGDPAQDLVDRPEAVVEQESPRGAGDDRRDHDRQDEQRHEDLPAGHAVEEQVGQQQAEDQLDRQGDREEERRCGRAPARSAASCEQRADSSAGR